tara:strand:- start:273 stop:509 length:237 start_codon:yes stop_codon:yes gene_type:complete
MLKTFVQLKILIVLFFLVSTSLQAKMNNAPAWDDKTIINWSLCPDEFLTQLKNSGISNYPNEITFRVKNGKKKSVLIF